MNSKLFLSLTFLFLTISFCYAAPGPPVGGPGCWPPPCVPIDGGISLLLLAGAVYGGKKLYNKKNNKSSL